MLYYRLPAILWLERSFFSVIMEDGKENSDAVTDEFKLNDDADGYGVRKDVERYHQTTKTSWQQ